MQNKDYSLLLKLIKKTAAPGEPDAGPAPSLDDTGIPASKPKVQNNYKPMAKKPELVKLPTNNVGKLQKTILNYSLILKSTDLGNMNGSSSKNRGQEISAIAPGGFGNPDGEKEYQDALNRLRSKIQDLQNSIKAETNPQKKVQLINQLKQTKSNLQQAEFEENKNKGSGANVQQEQLSGNNAFGNFLAGKIQQNNRGDAHQYLTVDVDQPNRDLNGVGAIDIKNFKGLVETISQIGTPAIEHDFKPKPGQKFDPKVHKTYIGRGEHTEDGKWDVRTNNALKAIYAATKSIFDLATDMKDIKLSGYAPQSLEQFGNAIPQDPDVLSDEEKNKMAPAFTTHIVAMENVLQQFKQKIAESPKYKKFINQDSAFSKINSSKDIKEDIPAVEYLKPKGLDAPTVVNYYNQYKDQLKPGYYGVQVNYAGKQMKFTYLEMSKVESFKAAISKYIGTPASNDDVRKVFKIIKDILQEPQGTTV